MFLNSGDVKLTNNTVKIFFLKKLKWCIILTQSVFPSTRCTKERQQSVKVTNNIYKNKKLERISN